MLIKATPEELAYIAGVFDGEGCIAIEVCKKPNRAPNHCLFISISNTHLPTLQWIQKHIGGSLLPTDKTKARIVYRIRIDGRPADRVLRALQPWLRIKQREATRALDFYRLMRVLPRNNTQERERELQRREYCRTDLQMLKRHQY